MDQWLRDNQGWLVPLLTLIISGAFGIIGAQRADKAKAQSQQAEQLAGAATSQAVVAKTMAETNKIQMEAGAAGIEQRFEVQKNNGLL